MRSKFLIGLTLLLIACETQEDVKEIKDSNQVEESSVGDLKSYGWLEGKWIDTQTFGFRNMSYMEDWEIHEDSLSGKGISIENGDTTVTETFALRMVKGKLMYIARPASEPMIAFPVTSAANDKLVFENKAHDFPRKISYVKHGADSLIIELNGIAIPQGERTMKFKLKHL